MVSLPMPSTERQNIDQKTRAKRVGRLSQKEKSERFIETARMLGIDKDAERFEAVARRVLFPHQPKAK